VLTDDAETAMSTALAAAGNAGSGGAPLVALTSPNRAARVLAAAVPHTAAVPTNVAAALIGRSALPTKQLRHVIIAMPGAEADRSSLDALDAVMSEIPKDATRTLVASRETPAVEAVVARHLFKARRTREAASGSLVRQNFAIRVIGTSVGARLSALRRVLDEADPPSVVVLADAALRDDIVHTVAAMGYTIGANMHVVSERVPNGASLVVVVGLPTTDTLRQAVEAGPGTLVVMCTPREIDGLRAIAGGMAVVPWLLDGPRAQAESAEAATRARLREILTSGSHARELLALAPLLDEYDGSEIAAAALALATEAQRKSAAREPPPVEASTRREDRPARPPGRGAPAAGFDSRKPRKPGGFRGNDRRR
jgi:hypothetical protein